MESDRINALLWMPPVGAPFGGHVVQMDMTARHLAELGVCVKVCRDGDPDWNGVDVVHGFGLSTADIREARRRRIPVALSVIYWSKAYRTGQLGVRPAWATAVRRGRSAGGLALAAVRGGALRKATEIAEWVVTTTALYEAADLLLPNSQLEADQLLADLGVTTPMRVTPNAVDPSLFPGGPSWDQRDGVLYVGRLEPHKNQLGLIDALRGTGVPLTIVGGDHPDHPRYAEAVRREAGDHVRIVGYTPHEELASHYASARVHAVPSMFETTGLVSLEAALSGCNVVTTEVGFAREYLGDLAWYCSPYERSSIRTAVLSAISAPPQNRLRDRILERYTWAHTAAATLGAYRELLDR